MSGIILFSCTYIQKDDSFFVVHLFFCFLRGNLLIRHRFVLLRLLLISVVMCLYHLQRCLRRLLLLLYAADTGSVVALLLSIVSKLRMVSAFDADAYIIGRHPCIPGLVLLLV